MDKYPGGITWSSRPRLWAKETGDLSALANPGSVDNILLLGGVEADYCELYHRALDLTILTPQIPTAMLSNAITTTIQPGAPRSIAATITNPAKSDIRLKPT